MYSYLLCNAGKKDFFKRSLFNQFKALANVCPEDNFYRRFTCAIALIFLYKTTKKFYGLSGTKSIDPIVFFKLCLVVYLEEYN